MAAPNDAEIELGRALYFGSRAFEQAPRLGDAPLPVDSAACASCHGPLGGGSREGAQVAPAIAGEAAHRWLRAAAEGRHADGSALSAAMPRYWPSESERAGLAAFAQVVGTAADAVRGVSDGEILFGLPEAEGDDAQVLKDVQRGVAQAFAQINARGGVHGRQLRLLRVRADAHAVPVFAWVASLARLPVVAQGDAAARLPSLASLAPEREGLGPRAATVPLLPSLREQARLLMHALRGAAGVHDCAPWLVDPARAAPEAEAAPDGLRRFSSIDAAVAALPSATTAGLCLGVVARADAASVLVRAVQRAGVALPWVGGLAAAGPLPPLPAATQQVHVLPTPLAVVAHAARSGQPVWTSLGQAAGNAVIEALARSGRLLQPELLRDNLRRLTGYAPIDDAPLAWSPWRAHGWPPSVLDLSAAPALRGAHSVDIKGDPS